MFGTFQKELSSQEYQPIQYGLTKNLETENAVTIVLHEWIQLFKDACQPRLTIKQRCLYIFGPPGYSHDGSRKTSNALREIE
ncbi:hypothetical protein ABTM89_19200, partial [Acinetobacter baumannii]